MARVPITATAVPDAGYNLTDSADIETMVAGATNGVTFTQSTTDRILLINGTGGALTYTVKVPTPAAYTALSVTIPDDEFTVPAGDTMVIKPNSLYRQTDGLIYVDCSGTGGILVLS